MKYLILLFAMLLVGFSSMYSEKKAEESRAENQFLFSFSLEDGSYVLNSKYSIDQVCDIMNDIQSTNCKAKTYSYNENK